MESGDGLLIRVRPARGARGIDVGQLRELVRLASAHGNGLIEVTRRARLQLRGVREDSLLELQNGLVRLGLGASSAAHERSAALIVNPYSGLSRGCAELDEVAEALEHALAASPECGALSDKFGVLLDSGGGLRAIAGDIHLDLDGNEREYEYAYGHGLVHVRVASGRDSWTWLGTCFAKHAAPVVLELCRALSELHDKPRMRELIESQGSQTLRERVTKLLCAASPTHLPPPAGTPRQPAGAIGFHSGPSPWLELGIAFGSAGPDVWRSIAGLASSGGTGEIRCTPWRTVILPGVSESAAVRGFAQDAGLIIDADDPVLRAVACAGAPACSSAHGETRSLARELAPLLAASESLHVAGCAKGCAQSSAADITLVLEPHGCKLGLGQSPTATASRSVLSVKAARTRLAQHHAGPPSPPKDSFSPNRTLAPETAQVQARGAFAAPPARNG